MFFTCGVENKLFEVKEPKRCHYVARFQTPLVCHEDAMLVYPWLSPELQNQWNEIETQLVQKELTQQVKCTLHLAENFLHQAFDWVQK